VCGGTGRVVFVPSVAPNVPVPTAMPSRPASRASRSSIPKAAPARRAAQTLEYGSWVAKLGAERLEALFAEGRYSEHVPLSQAFEARFGVPLPETLNEGHRLVIVAAELDAGTERIVEYLFDDHGVPVNAVLFRYFNDRGVEYLARSWVRDPSAAESASATRTKRTDPWNGRDFYITFGPEAHRAWDDGRRYGFVSAGGGRHWSKPLFQLQPGHRVFPYVPQRGYVGVGEVIDTARRIDEIEVEVDGRQIPLVKAPLVNARIVEEAHDPEQAEYVVRVRWDRAVPREQAYREPGMFAVPNSACKLRDRVTLEKLYRHFEVDVP
jgi:hypothetical protein